MRIAKKQATYAVRSATPGRRSTRKSARRRKCPLQREVLRDVMLSAGECATWLTLEELAGITRYPPASISAQLRHLRKPRHGGFRLEKRCRHVARTRFALVAGQAGQRGPVWEYRLRRQYKIAPAPRRARGGAKWA